MDYERLSKNKSLVEMALSSQWDRDPRDGKPLDCLHFDEHCEIVFNLKNAIDLELFSMEAGLKSALKAYTLFVCLYALGIVESDIPNRDGLMKVKQAISENVDSNWQEYYSKMHKSYSGYLRYLKAEDSCYTITALKQFERPRGIDSVNIDK